MRVRSAKAKGKRLERWVRDMILRYRPSLTQDDVRVTVGAETGADIKLSTKGRYYFPYAVECKNRETFGTIYKFLEQAATNAVEGQKPILFIKMNNKEPLVVLDAIEFFTWAAGPERSDNAGK